MKMTTIGLTDAIDFSLDMQDLMKTQNFRDMVSNEGRDIALGIALKSVLEKHPNAVVGEDIRFPDGSFAVLTDKGFEVGEE